MAKAIESQGVTLALSIGSPTSFVNIANVTDFSGPGGQASVIDVSNLSSTYREKLMSLADEGQITFNLNYDPDNAMHQALRNARGTRSRIELQLTLTDQPVPSVGIFQGYVLGFVVSGAVGAAVKAALTIEIDGPVSWT